jgi:hypothetical protein
MGINRRRSDAASIPDFRPESWTELLNVLYDQTWNEQLGRFRAQSAHFSLPSAARLDLGS